MLILAQNGNMIINSDNIVEFYIFDDEGDYKIKATHTVTCSALTLGSYENIDVARYVLKLISQTQHNFKMPTNEVVMEVFDNVS